MKHLCTISSLIICLLSACAEGRPDFVYSCDVRTNGWSQTDTLVFPFHHPFSEHESAVPNQQEMSLQLAVRYMASYPMQPLPLHFRLMDSSGKALSGYSLKLSLTDSDGVPEGTGWGSFTTLDLKEIPYHIQLPDTGSYSLLVWPETKINNIASLTVGFLYDKR